MTDAAPAADADATFDATQYVKNYPDGIERHYWNRARNAVIAGALRREGLAGARLLDIGCGRGLVTTALRDAGFDCHGVELAEAAPVSGSMASFVRTGVSFEDLPASERASVRGALLLDVLEHVPEPVAFLEHIRSALPRLETLLVTVPARKELWSSWDEFYGHRCRYDRPTLRRELRAAGYSVHACQYFFHGLYPFGLAINLFGGVRATHVKAPPESLLHRFVGRWFATEARVLPAFLPGSSLLAAARPTR